jgi:hypothetical protein
MNNIEMLKSSKNLATKTFELYYVIDNNFKTWNEEEFISNRSKKFDVVISNYAQHTEVWNVTQMAYAAHTYTSLSKKLMGATYYDR